MSKPWLSFFSSPLGFQGFCVLEIHQGLLDCPAPAILCVGNDAKIKFLKAIGVQSHDAANTGTNNSWRPGPLRGQNTPSTNVMHAFGIRPAYAALLHTVTFFVEDFAGLTPSAVILARWVQALMHDIVSTRPRLLIVHDREADTCAFCRQLDTELLVPLRKISPERPYSMSEIIALRETCFGSVVITTYDELPAKMHDEKEVTPHDSRPGFETNFRLMLHHLCK
ncbi:hypothetical protein F4678DRAFT_463980 [Xylaria arbuscula]|nr:hypothetical protein F4678DRAFT_463980 [Xylaria arbuscula]